MTTLLALLALVAPGEVAKEFTYTADRELRSVSLAGTFNNWDMSANPMQRDAGSRTWRTTVRLNPGKHLYKFVLDNSNWVVDPKASRNEDDGNGNLNSVLIIKPEGFERPALPNDGEVTATALRHLTEIPHLNWDRGTLQLRLRTRANDVNAVEVRAGSQTRPMRREAQDELYDTWIVDLAWNRQADLSYTFHLNRRPNQIAFGSDGLKANARPFVLNARTFQPFEVPGWVENTVFYQIFPDRFENGSAANDPEGVRPWGSEPTYWNVMGGDIAGIIKRIDHLKSLGVRGVYFNPIFESPANHRYETTNYNLIDPELGTNAEFREMTEKLHAAGIRSILDGVFNHTATNFPQFDDIVRNGEKSRYVNWFYIHSFPVKVGNPPNYHAWFGFPSMPKVNLDLPEPRDFMLAVPDFWQRESTISGWRLDVANEVSQDFWRAFRKRVKGLSPDNWIVGEVWGDASQWLKGDQWDSAMNYPFRDAAIRFIAKGETTATQFATALMRNYLNHVPQVSRNMMNLLGSHDTPRWLTECGNDRELAKLGVVMLLTWVGAPSIYYGDELGMEGGRDPDNRRAMRWDLATPSNTMLSLHRRLIALRNATPTLRGGDPIILHTNDAQQTMAFARRLDGELAVVAINRSNAEQTISFSLTSAVRNGARVPTDGFVDAIGGGRTVVSPSGSIRLRLGARQAAVLVAPRRISAVQETARPRRERGMHSIAYPTHLIEEASLL